MAEEKEWNPEDEIDPAKVQKEYLEVAKDMISQMKADKAKRAKEEEEYKAMPAVIGGMGVFRPPTMEEMSTRMKRAWEETKKIAPDAPEMVQTEIFRNLLHTSVEEGL